MAAPLGSSWLGLRFRHVYDREVYESDVIIAPVAEWKADPRAKDGSWSVWTEGDAVIALQLTIPSSVIDVNRAVPAWLWP